MARTERKLKMKQLISKWIIFAKFTLTFSSTLVGIHFKPAFIFHTVQTPKGRFCFQEVFFIFILVSATFYDHFCYHITIFYSCYCCCCFAKLMLAVVGKQVRAHKTPCYVQFCAQRMRNKALQSTCGMWETFFRVSPVCAKILMCS